MYTQDFSIFLDMVRIMDDQGLDKKIFYSYYKRDTTSKYKEEYRIAIFSSLYNIVFAGSLTDEESVIVKQFIQQNNCTKLNCKMEINNNQIELTNI